MLNDSYSIELQTVHAALSEAALLCRSVQERVAITKGDRSPVTIADFGSQALVCRTLREVFPDDPIIAEEDSTLLRSDVQSELRETLGKHLEVIRPGTSMKSALKWIDYGNTETYSDRFWTLDPIDGTKGFLRKEHFAVALALIIEGKVAVAGLACPNLDHNIFLAAKGFGARRGEFPLRVSTTEDLEHARICESVESGHSAHQDVERVVGHLGITAKRKRLDSQAKYAVVASGDAEIYMRLPTRGDYIERIWDHAAGALLLTEAGGKVTDCTGKELDFSCGKGLEHNCGIIGTNGKIHGEIIEALKTLNLGQSLQE
ncbi:MAG: 3'(2'),5'-bisphosphate nucleotidase [Rhodothermaceae bacterium]|nr:3'(2'),5'-bisphosphate nucleotidase [Rhodothermaceae bacterium]MXZ57417.1 3'(2'),5'-bisphosphate nucleotidase [Rhodothermaceae bacterium]MYB90401.1 3'(2'),5'-bisphosphate nucleotidase [Rhodothermaceae bacterium]MYD68292.1 3'(2'),5'-bisphosphate nucleotidase [Rhodothermaceae bacterium]MYG44282.1 3'(2'),5'-bisphosphate nucleotidase [Rhodothermaceae bacterium]